MEWIVTYLLLVTTPIGCPDFKKDDFGNYPTLGCLVNHVSVVKEKHKKTFMTLDSANHFAAEAIKVNNIDSVKIIKNYK